MAILAISFSTQFIKESLRKTKLATVQRSQLFRDQEGNVQISLVGRRVGISRKQSPEFAQILSSGQRKNSACPTPWKTPRSQQAQHAREAPSSFMVLENFAKISGNSCERLVTCMTNDLNDLTYKTDVIWYDMQCILGTNESIKPENDNRVESKSLKLRLLALFEARLGGGTSPTVVPRWRTCQVCSVLLSLKWGSPALKDILDSCILIVIKRIRWERKCDENIISFHRHHRQSLWMLRDRTRSSDE